MELEQYAICVDCTYIYGKCGGCLIIYKEGDKLMTKKVPTETRLHLQSVVDMLGPAGYGCLFREIIEI